MTIVKPSKVIVVNGVNHPNLYTAQVHLGLEMYKESELQLKAERLRLTVPQTLSYLHRLGTLKDKGVQQKAHERLTGDRDGFYLEYFSRYFETHIQDMKDLYKTLGTSMNQDFRTGYLAMNQLDILYYLIDNGLEPLALKRTGKPLEYNGIHFRDRDDFISYYDLNPYLFYAQVYKTNGDIEESITNAQWTGFPYGTIIYHGDTYKSHNELCQELTVTSESILKSMALDLNYQQAVNLASIERQIWREGSYYKGVTVSFYKIAMKVLEETGKNLYTIMADYIRLHSHQATQDDLTSILKSIESTDISIP